MQNFYEKTGFLDIKLQNLANNYKIFQEFVEKGTNVAGIVKANAYGLGLKPIVQTLETLNCPIFFVATPEEAVALRSINTQTPIAVLNGLFLGAEQDYIHHNLTPILNTPEEINRWNKTAQNNGRKLPAIIHFDTGMNRLGLGHEETSTFCEARHHYNGLDIQMVMSHFSCADNQDNPMNHDQFLAFDKIANFFPNIRKSLANSSGIFRDKAYHYDMVRPGNALYGGNPTPEKANPMHPVIELTTRILQIRHVKKNQSIGYNSTHAFDKDTSTATLAVGYADGFHRAGSNQTMVYYNGKACPVLGRVSMDLITIGIGHLDKQPQIGEAIEIIGPHQSIDDLASTWNTIGYEVLTSLGSRYHRRYI